MAEIAGGSQIYFAKAGTPISNVVMTSGSSDVENIASTNPTDSSFDVAATEATPGYDSSLAYDSTTVDDPSNSFNATSTDPSVDVQNPAANPSVPQVELDAATKAQIAAMEARQKEFAAKFEAHQKRLSNQPGLSAQPANANSAEFVTVPNNARIPVGTPLQAEWGGKWLPVEVIAIAANGKLRIHWIGDSSSWDTDKARNELRIEKGHLEIINKDPEAAKLYFLQSRPTEVTETTKLEVGQIVEYRSAKEWYPAKIIGFIASHVKLQEPNGNERVSPRSWLRIPAKKPQK